VIFLEVAGLEGIGDVVSVLSVGRGGSQDTKEKEEEELEKHGNCK